MEPSNDLKDSGILYGANFDDWKKRMMAILRIQGLEVYVIQNKTPQAQNDIEKAWNEKSTFVASIISMHVNPSTINLIPIEERESARRLMERLEAMSTHFRFLDLPAELRNRIYKLVLGSCGHWTKQAVIRNQTGYPNITKISSQVRGEALPVFYSSATFKLQYISNCAEGLDLARNWLLYTVGDMAKYLCAVTMALNFEHNSFYSNNSKVQHIRITFKAGEGLQIHFPKNLIHESKIKLREHAHKAKMASKLLGIQTEGNQALILALPTDNNLWRSGTLLIER